VQDIPKAHAAAEVLDAWILVVVGAEPAEPGTPETRIPYPPTRGCELPEQRSELVNNGF
jgi:hypothetical protein